MKNRILIAVVAAAMAQVVFGATETLNGVIYGKYNAIYAEFLGKALAIYQQNT